MSAYIIRRLIQGIVIIVLVSVIIFSMMHFLPGDPLLIYIAQNQIESISKEDYDALRVQYGLDKPLPVQYFNWASNVLHGDFGASIVYRDKVGKLLAERLPVTAHIAILTIILSTILGILAGLICALRRGGSLDTIVTSIANFGISIPAFWLGILMIYVFAYELKWLPIYGYTSPFKDFWLSTKQLVMPVLCLSLLSIAATARQTRSSILEIIRQDYIRTAWSKGLKERDVVIRHTLKNGLIPVVTLVGIHVALVFGGSVIIETVFNIPGMGRLLVNAVFAQDYPIVQGGCLLIAIIVVITNILVDIFYGWLDPRIRYS
jgi:peptide/nickel transport system permease protein